MDKEAFGNRVTSLQNRMYRIACSYLHNEHDCLDAISEAIARAWQKHATLKQEQYFDTWLIRILIRECINIQRKQKRILPAAEVCAQASLPAENEALRAALDALPQKLRIVMVLHYMEGYGVQEIGTILQTSKGAVCSRLSRGRDHLRRLLKEEIE